MPDVKVSLPVQDIVRVIETMKNIDVRGYESMNRLVATVVYFEGLLSALQAPQESPEADRIRKELEKRGEA